MRFARTMMAVVLVVAAFAGPAAAGTRATPEIQDPCTGQITNNDTKTTVQHETVDLCAVWLRSVAGGTGLRVTLQTFGELEGRPGGLYEAWWSVGGCTYSVRVDDKQDAELPRAFTASCGEPVTWSCPVPNQSVGCTSEGGGPEYALPASAVVVDGDEMQITVSFTGALAKYAGAHDEGSVLSQPRAFSSLVVGPVYAYMFGCTSNFPEGDHCAETNGDLTATGRNYTVPAS